MTDEQSESPRKGDTDNKALAAFLESTLTPGAIYPPTEDDIRRTAAALHKSDALIAVLTKEHQAASRLVHIVEGTGLLNYGDWRSEQGKVRLKDAPPWVQFYVNHAAAAKALEVKP